jgi:DNA-binding PadR family transcriptional regulator
MKRQFNQLPQVAFSVLLALSLRPRHGYEITKQIQEDSFGKIKLAPGALYTSIKKLHEQGLIEEISEPSDTRRYYKLTDAGSKTLATELSYYQAAVKLGQERQVLTMRAV